MTVSRQGSFQHDKKNMATQKSVLSYITQKNVLNSKIGLRVYEKLALHKYLDRGYYVRSCNKSFWQHSSITFFFFPREHFVESAVFLQRSSEGHYQKFYTVVMTKVADKKGRERWSQMHTPYTKCWWLCTNYLLTK